MAYVLGFFAADGNLAKGKRGNHYIEFNACDKELILGVRDLLGSNHKVTGRKKKENHKICYSNDLSYPVIPDEYFEYFVRGYFDGDGHVITGKYKRKNRPSLANILYAGFTSGTESFLAKLKSDLINKNIVKGGTLHFSKGFRLNFSNLDSISFYNFLYKHPEKSLYLSRKKEVFERFIMGR